MTSLVACFAAQPHARVASGTTSWRDPAKDFATSHADGNRYPQGLWSDGTTMWVTDSQAVAEKIFAYWLSDAATLNSLSLSPAFDGSIDQCTGIVFLARTSQN